MLCCSTKCIAEKEHSFVMFCAGDSFWPKTAFCFQLAFPLLSKFSDRREQSKVENFCELQSDLNNF